jgi:hypothetical protein
MFTFWSVPVMKNADLQMPIIVIPLPIWRIYVCIILSPLFSNINIFLCIIVFQKCYHLSQSVTLLNCIWQVRGLNAC